MNLADTVKAYLQYPSSDGQLLIRRKLRTDMKVLAANQQPTITVNHLRTICDQLRSVAGPQGRFWIREVFEKATGEKME